MRTQEVKTNRLVVETITNAAGGTPTIAGLSSTEQEFLDGALAGTVVASKAVVVDASKDVGDFRNLDAVNIDAGASGTAGTVDVFPATATRGKLVLAAVNNDGDTATTISNAAMGQASVVSIPDPGAATANFLLTSAANDQSLVSATAVEINVLAGVTPGTNAASKAVVAGADGKVGALTFDGTVTMEVAPVVPDGSFTAAKLANGAGLAALVAAGLGASAAYAKTTAGAQTLAAADPAAARAALIVVVVDETFDNGDGGQTTFTVGETDSADKFAAAALFTGATAGDIFVLAGSLTTNKALLVTGGAATGTGTGGVSVTALLLPAAA